ncbi:5-methylcytosine restriction system specificity protein McrC [Psychrobacter lutiphocae]|uniref:5-methylcytosine restriction system specificity protein McrC n=1 Tax=Psychrobacter lutiphocae TaxID=540500 RepID=UPI00036C45CD|nr:hypothetical protein [Psychrobacter lutiphocae]
MTRYNPMKHAFSKQADIKKKSAIQQTAIQQIDTEPVMSCFEHQWLTQTDFHYPQDFDYLVAQELACFDIQVKQGRLYLVVLHYLAKIVLPSGQVLEILPKISQEADLLSTRTWVATMLADIGIESLFKPLAATSLRTKTVNTLRTKTINTTNLHQVPNWQESANRHASSALDNTVRLTLTTHLARPWYEGVLAVAQQKLTQAAAALPSRYKTQVNNHPQAQGKLYLSAQLKHNWHRPHYLYTQQSRFVTDTVLARFLATGWVQLQQLTQGKAGVTPTSLQGIKSLPIIQWQRVYRQLSQDKKAQASWVVQLTPKQMAGVNEGIHWCWWLLTQGSLDSGLSLDTSANQGSEAQAPSPALMINMNHAFECWVLLKLANWVRCQLPGSQLLTQPRFAWLTTQSEGQLPQVIQRLTPDACIYDIQGKVTHVIDIKYKLIYRPQQISSRDWQQLAVYQQHLDCKHGWLIYPKSEYFTQRLDVRQNIDDNSRQNQSRCRLSQAYDLYSAQMSAIAFDLATAKLLI